VCEGHRSSRTIEEPKTEASFHLANSLTYRRFRHSETDASLRKAACLGNFRDKDHVVNVVHPEPFTEKCVSNVGETNVEVPSYVYRWPFFRLHSQIGHSCIIDG
jgi:hypothetical protein